MLSLKQATTPARCLPAGGDPSQPSQSQAKSCLRVCLTDSSARTGYGETKESRLELKHHTKWTHGKSRRSWLWVKKTGCWPRSMKRQVLGVEFYRTGFPIFCFLLSWWDREGGLGLCLNRAWTIPDCHSWSALKVFNGRDVAPVLLMNLYKTSEVFMKFPNCIIRVIIWNNLESWAIKRSLAFTIEFWLDFWNFCQQSSYFAKLIRNNHDHLPVLLIFNASIICGKCLWNQSPFQLCAGQTSCRSTQPLTQCGWWVWGRVWLCLFFFVFFLLCLPHVVAGHGMF